MARLGVIIFSAITLALFFNGSAVFAQGGLIAPPTGTVPGVEGRVHTLCDFFATGQNILNFLVTISVAAAGIGIMIGGFLIMLSGANKSWYEKGVSALKAGVIGLVIVFSAWLVVNTIINALVPGVGGVPLGFPWPWNQVRCI